MGSRRLGNEVAALVVLSVLSAGAGCSGASSSGGVGAGGHGGAAGTGTGSGGAAGTGTGGGGAAGAPTQAPARCVPPQAEGGGSGIDLEFSSTWCSTLRSCATCVWDVIQTIPPLSAMFVPVTTTCTFNPIICPTTSGATAASPPSCSYQPDAGHYDGVLLSGYPIATECQAINNEVVGLNSLPFDAFPCTLDGFVCVADCSACP
jgi:hypothetical protein